MARKTQQTAETQDNALTGQQSEAAETSSAVAAGTSTTATAAAEGNGQQTATVRKRRKGTATEREYWVIAAASGDNPAEFLISRPTVGQARKMKTMMLGMPMAKGRRLRVARVTYVD